MSRLGGLVDQRLGLPMCAVLLGTTVVFAASACSTSAVPTQGGPQPQRGGTLYLLDSNESFASIDPALVYDGVDVAFLDATLMRSLVSYTYSPDTETAATLQPDLASDTGTPNADATQWTFKLRDGPKWQDGTPITCADIKYGISRAFATDVLAGGPAYAIEYLDIPTEADGTSAYKGPYSGVGQDLYDKAVVCDGNTITFHLNQAVTDFNYATVWGMFPVKQSADTGGSYAQPGSPPPSFLSSGPYQIKSYTTGTGSMILERNPYWDQASDPVRKALPDVWEVDFGLDPLSVDQRLMASSGADATAVMYTGGVLQPSDLATVFADPHTPNPDFAGRAVSAYNPYVTYLWINTQKVPNELQREAIAVALDREALRLSASGAFYGDLADGVIPPNMGVDYAPTGWASDMFGEPVTPDGNPDLARRLIAQSGEPMPDLTFDYWKGPVGDSDATIVKNSLARAGINVKLKPMGDTFWPYVESNDTVDEFGAAAWGFDWPNASTIIPPMFTGVGGFNLSRVTDQDFVDQVHAALTTLDRQTQAAKWQALNKTAMQRAYVVPVAFGLSQTLGGTRVGPLYLEAPFDAWPYPEMGVLPE